jgi:hypothetical protein
VAWVFFADSLDTAIETAMTGATNYIAAGLFRLLINCFTGQCAPVYWLAI